MFVPEFTCPHCKETKKAYVHGSGATGLFVPCDCKKAREVREREHYASMERRKQLARKAKGRK